MKQNLIIVTLCSLTCLALYASTGLSDQEQKQLINRVVTLKNQLGRGNDQAVFASINYPKKRPENAFIADMDGKVIAYPIPTFRILHVGATPAMLEAIRQKPDGVFLQYPWPDTCGTSLKESYIALAQGDNGKQYYVGAGRCLTT